jgi:hypothetical protein
MALSPMVNHWWQVALYVTSRGLTTSPVPYGAGSFDVTFDFIDHVLLIETSNGARERFALKAMSVAAFHSEFFARLRRLGINVHIWTMPCEIPDAVPFQEDYSHAAYDAAAAQRFWHVLLQCHRVFGTFRSRFVGKASPVHFFWGSFDLAVTRFSGRPAPPHPGVAPNLANWVMREAYSHEVSSCGFWPGNGGYGRPAFYSYAYPEPPDFAGARIETAGAFYDPQLKEFLLPYQAVREAPDPARALMGFLQLESRGAGARGADRRLGSGPSALLAQCVGRETNHFGKLQELSRQRTRLAPDHADGSRGLWILEARDRHRRRARLHRHGHFRDQGDTDAGADHLNERRQ